MATTSKAVNTIILDSGPIIKNIPSVSTLLGQAENLVSSPSVIQEIKDKTTRERVQTLLLPFLTLRTPKPDSIRVISQFAQRTGDYAVLSKVDLEILALAYELECEKNGGDWRLRSTPGQKRLNGKPPGAAEATPEQEAVPPNDNGIEPTSTKDITEQSSKDIKEDQSQDDQSTEDQSTEDQSTEVQSTEDQSTEGQSKIIQENLEGLSISDEAQSSLKVQEQDANSAPVKAAEVIAEVSEDDSDSDGWITPSNINKKKNEPEADCTTRPEPRSIQVATVTTDYAMQNVLLQMNLNLLSNSLQRVKYIKTFILRCHACFNITKDLGKQFCSRCGKPTLTKVTCSTNANGEFKLHLKKNMQWNSRGDRYSIPKAVPGSANGKLNVGGGGKGGGKGGWGQDLILAEDQKEYVRAIAQEKRQKQRDLMDMDYLPAILSGDRNRSGGRPKVGAGRNVNSKKR